MSAMTFGALAGQHGPALCAAVVAGLAIGVWLAAVVERLPRAMLRSWAEEDASEAGDAIEWRMPPPLRGVAAIALRLLVVALSMALALSSVLRFGAGPQALAAYGLAAALLALAFIDAQTRLLPDVITLPSAACGLALNGIGMFVPFADAFAGCVVGYGALWALVAITRRLTGADGFGYGDAKLFGLLGAWLGVAAMPQVLFVSFVTAAAFGVVQIVRFGRDRDRSIAFGPFIAAGGLVTLFFGHVIDGWLGF
uniref:prepilin peptidase n=1 Tax=Burkholderia anthina TaxID=179879 RepID=UPI0015897669|nr:A24 family peptidase [Burkholderia anthina]